MFKKIYDYVKGNYEAGNYDDVQLAYMAWQQQKAHKNNASMTDFAMGEQQAQNDYQ